MSYTRLLLRMWWYLPVWFFVALATLYVEFRVIRWFVGVVLDTRNKVGGKNYGK